MKRLFHRSLDLPYILRWTERIFSTQVSRVSWRELCQVLLANRMSSLLHMTYETDSVRLWMKPLRRRERHKRLIRSTRLRIRWAFLQKKERKERTILMTKGRYYDTCLSRARSLSCKSKSQASKSLKSLICMSCLLCSNFLSWKSESSLKSLSSIPKCLSCSTKVSLKSGLWE